MEPKRAEHIETESRAVVTRNWGVEDIRRCWSKGTNCQL